MDMIEIPFAPIQPSTPIPMIQLARFIKVRMPGHGTTPGVPPHVFHCVLRRALATDHVEVQDLVKAKGSQIKGQGRAGSDWNNHTQ